MTQEEARIFSEDDLLPVSALADLVFCERRAALHLIEGLWDDNPFTVEGHLLHERAHEPETETRGDVRIARGLRLRSLRLGLTGKADVVEFHRVDCGMRNAECRVEDPGLPASRPPTTEHPQPPSVAAWRPFPVEYKRGRPKANRCDEVQLCAQALCLEEMLGVEVPAGAVFYGKTVRRLEVVFDLKLRLETEAAAARLHELIRAGRTPPALYDKKCESCSLINLCLPKAATGRSAERYLAQAFVEKAKESEPVSQ